MNKKLYTTGEFARLCATSKDTLFFYDRKGILKPSVTGENGYRYYSGDQYSTFSVIRGLRTAGASLSEIKEHFNSSDRGSLVKLLEANRAVLAKQQLELMYMQNYIDRMLASAEATYYVDGELHRRYCPEEYMIVTQTDPADFPDSGYQYSLKSVSRHCDYMTKKGYSDLSPVECSDIILKEDFLAGKFRSAFCWSRIPFEADDPNFRVKPSGTYAFACYTGSWTLVAENAGNFRALLEERGLCPLGDLYITDIPFTLLFPEEEEHKYMLSAKVEP